MKRDPLLLALLLPVVVLAALTVREEMARRDSQSWRIPVEGFDPRDTLRGLYVRFSYGFEVRGDAASCLGAEGCRLCLEQAGDEVVATVQTAPGQCRLPVDILASHIDARPGPAPGSVQFTNRIFISEASAPEVGAALQRGRMHLRAELGRDGRLVSRRLE